MGWPWLLLLLLLQATARASALGTVVVDTPSGKIRGVDRGRSTYFKGIPFAQPPVGNLRWRAPRPVAPWNTTLDATQFKHSCWQAQGGGMGFPQPAATLSEDCLYLNVYAPPVRPVRGLVPVIFWIYGGGFHGGGGNETRLNGTWDVELFPDDVVIVTHNYRLNVFGFLAADALREPGVDASTGNYGILDQRAALRWTHDHVRAFGGDPSRVLIVGQSAGANSVAQHLVRPASWPYFSSAGMESGAFYDSWTLTTGVSTTADLEPQLAALLARAGCPGAGAGGIECLRAKPTDAVFKAMGKATWVPSIDGVDLPAPGPVLAANGTMAPVPVFAGYVAEDISPVLYCCLANCTRFEFEACARLVYSLSAAEATELASLYAADPVPPNASGTVWFWAAKHAGADQWGGCPARRVARWATRRGRAGYFYRWSHTPYNPADGGAPGNAHHALEQPFVFHVLSETPEELREDHGRYFVDPRDEPLSRAVAAYWLGMARDGRPSPGAGTIGPPWPAWTEAAGEGLVFGDNAAFTAPAVSAVPALRKSRCDFWDGVFFNASRAGQTAAQRAALNAAEVVGF